MKNKAIVTLTLVLVAFFLFSCSGQKEKEKKDQEIGKYVYVDSQGTLHIKNPCYSGLRITDEDGNSYKKSVTFVDTEDINGNDLESLCPMCVRDEHYEQLLQIVKHKGYGVKHD